MKNFSKILKDSRLKAGKSLEQISREVGISVSSYHAYERGKAYPKLDRLPLIAASLGVKCADFFEDLPVFKIDPVAKIELLASSLRSMANGLESALKELEEEQQSKANIYEMPASALLHAAEEPSRYGSSLEDYLDEADKMIKGMPIAAYGGGHIPEDELRLLVNEAIRLRYEKDNGKRDE